MERLDRTAPRAIRAALANQPTTPGKVMFAWSLAAGATLARAATPSWQDGVLHLSPRSETWRQELVRARPLLIARLQGLLGVDAVRRLVIAGADDER